MSPVPPVPAALARHVVARIPYDVEFGAPGVHRGLPSTTVTLVLPLDEPLRVAWADQPDSLHTGWSSLSGLHTQPAAIHHAGSQRGVHVALSVAGARAILGRPAAALTGALTDVDETDRLPRELRELPERWHDLDSWAARVALVDRTLAALVLRHGDRAPRPEVGRALEQLARGARVAAVAADVGYSRRRLTTLVRTECGLTPQDFRRIARFEAAQGLIGHRPLAEVAACSGYSDQAHLSREWSALAGCSPTTWLREEFPFVQDPDAPAGALSTT